MLVILLLRMIVGGYGWIGRRMGVMGIIGMI
jgi:hypothetical protein